VDDIAFAVEVVAVFAGDFVLPLGEVILLEERLNIFARDNAGTLVLEQGRRVTLEDLDGVAETFEGDTGEEASQRAADLEVNGKYFDRYIKRTLSRIHDLYATLESLRAQLRNEITFESTYNNDVHFLGRHLNIGAHSRRMERLVQSIHRA